MGLRGSAFAAACAVGLIVAAPASAAVESVFGGAVACEPQEDGTRFCGGANTHVATFDGLPIDVNVALPAAPKRGRDGAYPLVMVFHGYGGSELGLSELERWTRKGYAAFSMSDRGFGRSCGGKDQLADPACADGHVRLMDTRYEVRDAQTFAGMLVDDGVVDRRRIGATGGSYGGGMSMALAALRNRTMMPDGSLAAWRSPAGKPMRIAAAAPEIPWTDLANALMPNGATLDYVADAPYGDRIGVMKETFVTGLFASGLAAGRYAAPLAHPDADLVTWYAALTAGEPYEANPIARQVLDEVQAHHSSYYIDDSIPPAPLLISNGWTDDLFPADEAIRFYNRTRTRHPGADISLYFLDYGHQRGQNKEADEELLRRRQNRWFAHYLKGAGREPRPRVEALTQTCPKSEPSGGPYRASSWARIARGEIRLAAPEPRTIVPVMGDTAGLAFDPIAGGGACATAPDNDPAGAVTYGLPPAAKDGYTLLGAPTLIAEIDSPGPHSQIAARLLDVGPDGRRTLVARGLWRPAPGSGPQRQVFQLHPNGYRFEPGHVAKLELLPADVPYGRPTNAQAPVTLANVELRLPVRERPGAGGGMVERPAPKVVPAGYELARDFRPVTEPGG
jgi:predicted acyl esterase